MNFVSARRDHRRFAVGSALIALAFVAVLAFAARAQAAENIYWDNYSGPTEGDTVSFADITGGGGGLLSLGAAKLDGPEGMAYDSVTNRLFVGSSTGPNGQILAINLDGSGATPFTAPGAPIEEPEGIAIDPTRRLIFWVNTEGGGEAGGSIGWAKLDGSAGGLLNTTGATVEEPYRGIAVDPVSGKVYWSNSKPAPETISFANGDNTGGGGTLNLSGAPAPTEITGMVTDPASGRLYWLDNEAEKIGYVGLGGGNGGEVNLTGAVFNDPYGLAFDPSIGRFYWGNYGNTEVRENAIGFVNLAGGGGGISPVSAPVNGPQDPVILKSPTGTGAPAVTRAKGSRSTLNCSTGSWAADSSSYVYQAPRTFAYQWTKNGKVIGGATAPTYNAKSAGEYGCIVTAVNQTGSAAQTSKGLNVKAAKLKLSTKKKANGKPGKVVSFKVKATNQGDVKSGNAKVCVKLPGSAKGELKAPKCKSLGKLKGQAKKSATLKIKVLPSAGGTYKVKFQVKGAPGKAAKAKIIVG
jgi:hypothetical protein